MVIECCELLAMMNLTLSRDNRYSLDAVKEASCDHLLDRSQGTIKAAARDCDWVSVTVGGEEEN